MAITGITNLCISAGIIMPIVIATFIGILVMIVNTDIAINTDTLTNTAITKINAMVNTPIIIITNPVPTNISSGMRVTINASGITPIITTGIATRRDTIVRVLCALPAIAMIAVTSLNPYLVSSFIRFTLTTRTQPFLILGCVSFFADLYCTYRLTPLYLPWMKSA